MTWPFITSSCTTPTAHDPFTSNHHVTGTMADASDAIPGGGSTQPTPPADVEPAAPAAAGGGADLREDQIQNAVSFLSHPKVCVVVGVSLCALYKGGGVCMRCDGGSLPALCRAVAAAPPSAHDVVAGHVQWGEVVGHAW